MFRFLRSPLVAFALAFFLSMPLMATAAPVASSAQTPTTAKATTANKLDINTATPDQLKALPGIGDAYAKRIIDGRPYTAKNQLTSRGILPVATYNKIKDQIIASRPKK